tara:strand:+ start:218 stop:1321 length:1104 start_codon:yes stop_codon:yes gene_type:complete
MKKIGFYLAHPAHFHLFKNIIENLIKKNYKVLVVYNDKDVLHELIKNSSFFKISYRVKTNKDINSKIALLIQFFMKNWGAFIQFFKFKPEIVLGTPILISLIGKVLRYKSIIVNEDDFDIIKKTADFGYPYANTLICPEVCRTTKFDKKSVKHQSYHELAYLHPNNFKANKKIVKKYFDPNEKYFLIRFAKLTAHHDDGIKGINKDVARKIIELLYPYGRVLITSERKLESEFEKYRININPMDIHDVMAYASIYIGDSQTMAAEAAVLGIPFIRFNDFVGKISYLDELENKYSLGFGIKTNEKDKLIEKVQELIEKEDLSEIFQNRRKKMLLDKIDFASFLTWFIENYPDSIKILKNNSFYQYKFK